MRISGVILLILVWALLIWAAVNWYRKWNSALSYPDLLSYKGWSNFSEEEFAEMLFYDRAFTKMFCKPGSFVMLTEEVRAGWREQVEWKVVKRLIDDLSSRYPYRELIQAEAHEWSED